MVSAATQLCSSITNGGTEFYCRLRTKLIAFAASAFRSMYTRRDALIYVVAILFVLPQSLCAALPEDQPVVSAGWKGQLLSSQVISLSSNTEFPVGYSKVQPYPKPIKAIPPFKVAPPPHRPAQVSFGTMLTSTTLPASWVWLIGLLLFLLLAEVGLRISSSIAAFSAKQVFTLPRYYRAKVTRLGLCVGAVLAFLAVSCGSQTSQANVTGAELEKTLAKIKERDSSIESYHIQGRRLYLNLPYDEWAAVEAAINDLKAVPADEVEQRFFDLCRGLQNYKKNWAKVEGYGSGERLKYEVSYAGEPFSRKQFTGSEYRVYHPITVQRQLDIYPAEKQVHIPLQLSDLGVNLENLLEYDVTQWMMKKDRQTIQFKVSSRGFTTIELDENLILRHLFLDSGGERQFDKWYFGCVSTGKWYCQRMTVRVDQEDCSFGVKINIIDELEINPEVTEEQLDVGLLPPWTLVVDHREKPVNVAQLVDRPAPNPPPDSEVQDQLLTFDELMDRLSRGDRSNLGITQINNKTHSESSVGLSSTNSASAGEVIKPSWFDSLVRSRLWMPFGWTMLHFLWIGAVVGLIGGALRIAFRASHANIRYAVVLCVFCALAVAPMVVFTIMFRGVIQTERANRQVIAEIHSSDFAGFESDVPLEPPLTGQAAQAGHRDSAVRSQKPGSVTQVSSPREGYERLFSTVAAGAPWVWLIGSPLFFLVLAIGLTGAENLRGKR